MGIMIKRSYSPDEDVMNRLLIHKKQDMELQKKKRITDVAEFSN